MEMIMHRYGRNKMNEVFPERSDAQEREITLSDFLLQVRVRVCVWMRCIDSCVRRRESIAWTRDSWMSEQATCLCHICEMTLIPIQAGVEARACVCF